MGSQLTQGSCLKGAVKCRLYSGMVRPTWLPLQRQFVPKRKRHVKLPGAPWGSLGVHQEALGVGGEYGQEPLWRFLQEEQATPRKQDQDRGW